MAFWLQAEAKIQFPKICSTNFRKNVIYNNISMFELTVYCVLLTVIYSLLFVLSTYLSMQCKYQQKSKFV